MISKSLTGCFAALILLMSVSLPVSGEQKSADSRNFKYTVDWVTPYDKLWKLALSEIKGRKNLNYLEIGVHEGRSLIWMFDNILTHPSSKATVLDAFQGRTRDNYDHNVKEAGLTKKVTLHLGRSQKSLRGLEFASYDLVYVDGSHEPTDVLTDAVLVWDLVKPGGLVIFDDYKMKAAKGEGSIEEALDAFVNVYRYRLSVVHKDYQLHVKKIR